MKTVMELSKNIIEGFREKQKARLQRTFVEASDAASSKVKGQYVLYCVYSKRIYGFLRRHD